MGRISLPKEKRRVTFSLTLAPSEIEALDALADVSPMSRSSYIRKKLAEAGCFVLDSQFAEPAKKVEVKQSVSAVAPKPATPIQPNNIIILAPGVYRVNDRNTIDVNNRTLNGENKHEFSMEREERQDLIAARDYHRALTEEVTEQPDEE